jgi:hypothetical protein
VLNMGATLVDGRMPPRPRPHGHRNPRKQMGAWFAGSERIGVYRWETARLAGLSGTAGASDAKVFGRQNARLRVFSVFFLCQSPPVSR